MIKPKFIDILNSAIAEFYCESAVMLLKYFSNLNQKGQTVIIEHAEMCFCIPEKYSKTMKLAEKPTDNKIIISGR